MIAEHIAFGITAVRDGGRGRPGRYDQERRARRPVAHRSSWPAWRRIFILLAAEFVAVVQVLVYIGAIVVLFLFGIMLTRAPIGRESGPRQQPAAGRRCVVVAVLIFGLLGVGAGQAFGRVHVHDGVGCRRTADVGQSVFTQYVVPFEAVSVVLLAALVGAVVIARRD